MELTGGNEREKGNNYKLGKVACVADNREGHKKAVFPASMRSESQFSVFFLKIIINFDTFYNVFTNLRYNFLCCLANVSVFQLGML